MKALFNSHAEVLTVLISQGSNAKANILNPENLRVLAIFGPRGAYSTIDHITTCGDRLSCISRSEHDVRLVEVLVERSSRDAARILGGQVLWSVTAGALPSIFAVHMFDRRYVLITEAQCKIVGWQNVGGAERLAEIAACSLQPAFGEVRVHVSWRDSSVYHQ